MRPTAILLVVFLMLSVNSYSQSISDDTYPVITDSVKGDIIHDVRTPFTPTTVSAYDKIDGDLTDSVKVNTDSLDVNTIGEYEITYTVSDNDGNTTTLVKKVYVVDRKAPILFGAYDLEVVIHDSTFWVFEGLKVEDNYYPPSVLLPGVQMIDSNIDIGKEGLYYATFTVTDLSGNTSIPVQRMIRVVSKICGGDPHPNYLDAKVEVYPKQSTGIFYVEHNLLNKCDLHITVNNVIGKVIYEEEIKNATEEKITFDLSEQPNGIYYITIRCGNSVKLEKVVLTKKHPPTINNKGNSDTTIDVHSQYIIEPVTAYDKEDGDLIDSVKVTTDLDTSKVGTYTVQYTVMDSDSNIIRYIRKVNVVDREAPVIYGAYDLEVALYDTTAWVFEGLKVKDNCDSPNELKQKIQVVDHNIDFFREGLYHVSFIVVDSSGNVSDTVDRMVLVRVISRGCGPHTPSASMSIYPNPSSGVVNIDFSTSWHYYDFEVVVANSLGDTLCESNVYRSNSWNMEFDLSEYPDGIYRIAVYYGSEARHEKLIIIK